MRVLKLIALALPVLLAAPAFAAGGVNHDQHGGAGVLQFLPNVLFWEYIAFGIILVVLGGFVFPKLFKQLDARQKGIQDALDKADDVDAAGDGDVVDLDVVVAAGADGQGLAGEIGRSADDRGSDGCDGEVIEFEAA